MPTIACPDCGHEVSTAAPACPNCGLPRGSECPHCHRRGTLRDVKGLKGRENLAGAFLLLFMFLPGIIYYIDRTRLPYCTACHRRIPRSAK